jgi:hypothetical protein
MSQKRRRHVKCGENVEKINEKRIQFSPKEEHKRGRKRGQRRVYEIE